MSKLFVVEYPNLRPAMWALNAHVQTLMSAFVQTKRTTKVPQKHVVTMLDGDRIVIHDDQAKSWITGDRIAILVHGLCGCHDSSYMRRTAIRLRQHGIRTIRIDMRGFGDSQLISRGHLHAGGSSDVLQVVKYVEQLSPLSKISLVGFSLGANIVLKLLAELDVDHQTQIDSAISIAPPINLEHCSANLRAFGNRFYEQFFLSRMARNLQYRRRRVKGLLDNGMNPIPSRLVHFDDQFTAPLCGYSGARDYYRKCSTHEKLDRIHIPTILVAAKDDPVVPFEVFDTRYFSPQIEFVYTEKGGHLGFIGNPRRDPDQHWLDWRICSWLGSLDSAS